MCVSGTKRWRWKFKIKIHSDKRYGLRKWNALSSSNVFVSPSSHSFTPGWIWERAAHFIVGCHSMDGVNTIWNISAVDNLTAFFLCFLLPTFAQLNPSPESINKHTHNLPKTKRSPVPVRSACQSVCVYSVYDFHFHFVRRWSESKKIIIIKRGANRCQKENFHSFIHYNIRAIPFGRAPMPVHLREPSKCKYSFYILYELEIGWTVNTTQPPNERLYLVSLCDVLSLTFARFFSTFWLFGWHFGFDIISSFCFWLVLVNSRLVYCSGHHYPKSRSFISINCVGGERVCDIHQSISKVIWIDSVHFRSNCELHRCQSVHADAATAWNNNKLATATRRDENSLKIDIAVKWLWRSAVAYPRVSPVTIYTRKWSFAVATLLSSPIYHFVYVRINYFVRHLWFMQHGWESHSRLTVATANTAAKNARRLIAAREISLSVAHICNWFEKLICPRLE